VRETDLTLADGRTLHAYDTERGDLVVYWHHGTPNIGTPPKPLFEVGDRLGIRWIAHDRPGYGASTPRPGRDVASAAGDVAAVADALGVERFAVLGHSGGTPHALACAALLPDRVLAAAGGAGLAPHGAAGLDWLAGMSPLSELTHRSSLEGRAAREAFEAADRPEMEFTPTDLAAFDGDWGWFAEVVGPAIESGPAAQVDDDLAYVAPWGFDPGTITAPILLLHGEADRVVPAAHSRWLAEHCPTAELRLTPGDGHISVLNHAASSLEWLARHRS
jgi:pimeloyl-ACP methyl ester carboxylesterase